MIDMEQYISELLCRLKSSFCERLVYVGLQGSYLRGEATKDSDIDIMIVIDDLQISDLDYYRKTIESMAYYDKSCGFICGKSDLAHWNPLEICHLLHTTKDYWGTLRDLVPVYTKNDICNFIKVMHTHG